MKFSANKRYYFSIFLIISSFIFQRPQSVYAEANSPQFYGSPIIQTFRFPDYCFNPVNFSVYEDPQGFYILGAYNQMILFYGNEFISLPIEGQVNVIANQRAVFYTANNTLGIVKFYNNSLPQLIPLISNVTQSNHFGQIYNVFLSDNYLVFNTKNKLFATTDGSVIRTIDSSKFFIQLFRVHDKIYIYKPETGLSIFSDNKITPFISFLTNNDPVQIFLPYQNGILLKTFNQNQFYYIEDATVHSISLGIEKLINQWGISDLVILPNNELAVATRSSGIFIYNTVSRTIKNLNAASGLLDNMIINLHLDNFGNLWVFHQNGISRIELNVNVSVLGQESNISGIVTDFIKYKNHIYIATSNGLFKANYKSTNDILSHQVYFNSLDAVRNKYIKLAIVENKLIAVSTSGVSLYTNESNYFFPLTINAAEVVTTSQNFIITANNNGIYSLIVKDNAIQFQDTLLSGLFIQSMAIEGNLLWCKTLDNQLKLFEFQNKNNNHLGLIEKSYVSSQSNYGCGNFYFLKTQNGIRFCYDTAIYYYNRTTSKLEPISSKMPISLAEIPYVTELFTDNNIKWYHISGKFENQKGILLFNQAQKSQQAQTYFFQTHIYAAPIYFDSNMVWIGAKDKVFLYNKSSNFINQKDFIVIIKKVLINKDSLLRIQLEDPEIAYRYRHIRFVVSSTAFEGEPFVRYQYRLKGYDSTWTSWTRESEIAYSNLEPGNYTFQVRALNVDGSISEITELNFTILHPFYLTLPAYILYIIVVLIAMYIYFKYRTWRFIRKKEEIDLIVQKRTAEILKEKEKSEQLIANLLPKETADELRQTGKASSQKFSMVTVLFSDIQGFTKIAEQMNPEMLIDQLDAFFFHFDSVIEKYNIEKIKTIGDAYMCAGGIPNKNITNPIEVVLAALEMQEYMKELKSKNANIWDLRIGIHTGSVIAGVVGHKKLSYDIWGDTVNTASRMESSGEAGKINISGHTYELVKDFFVCEYRGKMPVKYKGEIDMYFVKGIQPDLCEGNSYTPNAKFFLKLQLLRLQDIEEVVFEKAKNEFPANLYFHTPKRLQEVYELVELYSRAEELSDEDTLLIRTAALFMDIGYIWSYDDHETYSINYARELLPTYKYSNEQIEMVVTLIDCTRGLRKPENILEEILLDAEMNYLSRADFEKLNEQLYQELADHNKAGTWDEWVKMQIVLLSNHKYYTRAANMLRDVMPDKQIEILLKNIK